MSFLRSLGYVGLPSENLDDWITFGTTIAGMQVAERTKSSIKFRMDDRKQRLIVNGGGHHGTTLGWEVDNAQALDALSTDLERKGVRLETLTRSLCDERFVRDGISFS